ncbi:D-serine ammonia-lyase [Sagittula stellata]|uniref:Probable D-serine dehydratase n=1 Tax=Sagittula stellata (strain ATCC 700073 / DSM 11524 / E-37) TaxID=388399 RepID=A3K383_SAGS3|nr:D-serine ammonia-lyase [Sagittula stellata]EBA08642.1 D-serine dehydratase [Sagittula stellata E-37]
MADDLDALRDTVRAGRSALWANPAYLPAEDVQARQDLDRALADWRMLAPLLARVFPDLEATHGHIGSDLIPVPEGAFGPLPGHVLIKGDHALPVAGSIKARGGIFEVFMCAVTQSRAAGLLGPDDPVTKLAETRDFFAQRTIAVGSTGNLGLSVGIAARALGYRCIVHMSHDAKAWKFERLRKLGVEVVLHTADYTAAVAAAREATDADPDGYFVDDESSELLFRGYSAAAAELAIQLDAMGIAVTPDKPLCLYLPCGIGGAPGGIAYGARAIFGAAAHSFFVEPQQSASALCQMAFDAPSVHDLGLSNRTEADGMAVATLSPLVHARMRQRLAGVCTVGDADMLRWVACGAAQGLRFEPSATAGFAGPLHLVTSGAGAAFRARHLQGVAPEDITHIVWATGGRFVPDTAHAAFLASAAALPEAFDLPQKISQ